MSTFPTVSKTHTLAATEALMSAFTWERSPEGHEYWSAIHDRLVEIAREAAND